MGFCKLPVSFLVLCDPHTSQGFLLFSTSNNFVNAVSLRQARIKKYYQLPEGTPLPNLLQQPVLWHVHPLYSLI